MNEEYLTILEQACSSIEEKKSKFICRAKPVLSEAEALEFIAGIKAEHRDATHNVYSYNVTEEVRMQRFSDDGEPSGTAGLPVTEAIAKAGLQNIAMVVTRYFGGTKLGAPGLTRAYGKSAATCIEQAVKVRKIPAFNVTLNFEYHLLGRLKNMLVREDYDITDTKFETGVAMALLVPKNRIEDFRDSVNEVLNGKVEIAVGETAYLTKKI